MAFLLGTAEVLPSIVDHAELDRANGQMWSAERVMGQLVGPPLARALTAGAAGGAIGGLVAPAVAARAGIWVSLRASLAVRAGAHLLLALTHSPVVTGTSMIIEALAGMLWNVVTVSYRQRTIPDDLLGRVNSIYRFFGWGAMPLGALAGGALVSLGEALLGRDLALRLPMFAAGALLALLALVRLRQD